MKKTLLSISCFLAVIFSTQAQVLYGTTNAGGPGIGTIIKFIPSTNSLSVVYSAEIPSSTIPYYTHFIQASNGKLYGMATNNGRTGQGVIFL